MLYRRLYCILFLHQTTTEQAMQILINGCIASSFYIKPQPSVSVIMERSRCIASSFYIKPQPRGQVFFRERSCIASSFYIKPQQMRYLMSRTVVVLHPLSTSNHNDWRAGAQTPRVVLHPLSTSNHNYYARPIHVDRVVLHPLSTSNHNPRTPDTLIFGHLTASRHDTKRGGVHRGSRFDAVFTFSTNIRKIIFTEIRRCMSVQRAGARLRSDSSEANI